MDSRLRSACPTPCGDRKPGLIRPSLGDENLLRGEIKRLEDAGVTDFNAAIMDVEDGAYERTLEFLGSLNG